MTEAGWRVYNCLKKNSSLLRSASIYVSTAALTAGTPLLLLPFLTRIMTPEEYGKIAMFSAAVQIFSITTGLSTHGAVGMKFFDREKVDFPRFVSSCLLVLLTSATLTLLVAWAVLGWLEQLTTLPGSWLLIAVIISALGFIVQVQLSIWQSNKNAAGFGALRTFQGVTDLGASVVLVMVLGLNWQGRVAGIVIGGFAASACALFTLFRGRWLRLPQDMRHIRGALRFGLPLIPHSAGGLLIMISDRLLITNVLDISFTGIYLVASQLGMVLYIVNDALNRAYSPLLIETLKKNDPDQDRKVIRLTYIYFAGMFLVALAFGAIAPTLVGMFAGPKFQAAGSIFMFIAVGQAFSGMYLMVATYIFYANCTAYLAMVTITAGVANLGITYWLLSQRGLIGAAEAFMVTQLLFFLGTWSLAQRCRPMPWFSAVGLDPTVYAKGGVVGIGMVLYASALIPPSKWELFNRSASRAHRDARDLIDVSRTGDLDGITALLARGVDVNSANSLGVTPLIAATAGLQRKSVELLLSRGADRSRKTIEGFTAYNFAKNLMNEELARLLAYQDRKQ